MTNRITPSHRYRNSKDFREWVRNNRLELCAEMTAVNEELTQWDALFYVRGLDGNLLIDMQHGIPVTRRERITTTPGKAKWLR